MNSIVSRLGIEYEVEDILSSSVRIPNFDCVGDASVESPAYFSDEFNILLDNTDDSIHIQQREVKKGDEYVSHILSSDLEDYKELERTIKMLTKIVYEKGEHDEGERSGIHIHIGMSYNLDILKNLVKLSEFSETMLFYIGGMGYRYRGESNDSIYCRPVTKYGPICVPTEHGHVQCFNSEDLLTATSSRGFWRMYGDQNEERPDKKYIPIRYHVVSLYNLLTKGTIEFRPFNKTMNPYYILAAIEFCQKFCEISLSNLSCKNLPMRSIYDTQSKDSILEDLNTFARLGELSPKSLDTLSMIILRTPPVNIRPYYVKSHLEARMEVRTHFMGSYSPKRVKDIIKSPRFIDRHVFEDGRRIEPLDINEQDEEDQNEEEHNEEEGDNN